MNPSYPATLIETSNTTSCKCLPQ